MLSMIETMIPLPSRCPVPQIHLRISSHDLVIVVVLSIFDGEHVNLPMLLMVLNIVRESFEGFINSEASACLGCQWSVLHRSNP